MKKVNLRKAAIVSAIAIIADMLVGNLLYMNPFVSGIFRNYEGNPSSKSMDFFGGIGNWVFLNTMFSFLLLTIYIALYLLFYESIPGRFWKKGVFFGITLWLVKAMPEAFNQWMLFNYPTVLILIPFCISLIDLLFLFVLYAILVDKFKVVEFHCPR